MAAAMLSVAVCLAACSAQEQPAKDVKQVSTAAESSEWAFPGRGGPPAAGKPPATVSLADGSMTLPRTDLLDPFSVPDWRPQGHPPAPSIIMRGRRPHVKACGFCHLPDGSGAPTTTALAGLPEDFIREQILAMQTGVRKKMGREWVPSIHMHEVAVAMRPDEIDAASKYYASLKFRSKTTVVERDMVPPYREQHYIYKVDDARPSVRLTGRIIETPRDFASHSIKDPNTRYIAYVPAGAIARGARLARRDAAGQQPCAACHGMNLAGGLGPPIAGRYPTNIARQLLAYRDKVHGGAQAAVMVPAVTGLSDGDIVDLAAYVGSLPAPK